MELRKGFKKTEVGQIPEDWTCEEVGSLGRIIRGASPRPKGDPRYYGGNIPRLMVEDVTRDGKFVTPRIDFLTEEGAKKSRPCPKGTITIVCSGTVGVTSFLAVDACIHDGFLALTEISKNTNSDYLYHQFCILREKFDNSATHGGVFTNLTTSGVKEFKIALPTTQSEQTAIANALSDADALIGSLQKLIAKKRQIKQGAMQTLLNPYENGVLKIDWEIKSLGDVLEKIVGGGTPSRSNPLYWGSEIPWITVKDFATHNPYGAQEYVTKAGLKNSASHLIPKDTLITSTRMALGKAVRYKVDVCINQDLKAMFPVKSVDTKYLFYWFQFNENKIAELGSGSTVMGISLVDLKRIPFPKPPLAMQTYIATVLSDMDAEISCLETKLAKYQQIKQGMMQNLLTGRIRLV